MRPARFVTLCFLYCGLLLIGQSLVLYQFQLNIGVLAQLGVGLSILAAGAIRLWRPEEERQNPKEWGLLTHGMAVLSLAVTAIFLAQLVIL